MKALGVLLGVGGALALVLSVSAASPLTVTLDQTYAWRHVLQDDDLLVISRYRLVPLTTTSDTFAKDTYTNVTVTSGDLIDCCKITNRNLYTDTTGMLVRRTTGGGSPQTITDKCTLAADRQQLTCIDTGISDGTYTFTVNYTAGWSAYLGAEAIYQERKASGAVVLERDLPATGYAIVGLYLTAAQVVADGITWGDASSVRLLASPTLWSSPSSKTQAMTWRTTASHAETVTMLTADLRQILVDLEHADPNVADGAYVMSAGITDLGTTVSINAWAGITQAIPMAFQRTIFTQGKDWVDKPISMQATISAEAANTSVGKASSEIGGALLGKTGSVFGMLVSIVLAIITAIAVIAKFPVEDDGMKAGVVVGLVWLEWLGGMLMGWTPDLWFWLVTAVAIVAGLLMVVGHYIFADRT